GGKPNGEEQAGLHEQLLRRDREIEGLALELQAMLASLEDPARKGPARSLGEHETVAERCERYRRLRYRLLVRQLGEIVRQAVPPGALLLAVSRGDEDLVRLDGRPGWHFPCTPEGAYASQHPVDSEEAIRHLEELRGQGADFLLFPSTAFWWLEHYA